MEKSYNTLNSDTASAINRAIVLKIIKEKGPISRKEITAITSLQASTMTYIINDLIKRNLVENCGKGLANFKGGRKPVFLRLNNKTGVILGLEIGAEFIKCCQLNFSGDIIKTDIIKFSNIDINMIVSHIADYVQKINKTILGISIGLPGVVDPVTGIIINSRYLQLANYPLKKKLQYEFKCPILINNNANLAAFAEYYNVAQQKNIKNILFLYIQELFVNNVTHIGFGLGIIINGQIYHGEHLQAGEFNKAINFYKNKLIDNNETAALLQKKDMDRLQQNSLPELFQKSQNGDKAAALFIDKLFSILSELISMAISIIDPGITFIGYDSNQKLDPLFLNHLREFLLKKSLNVTSKLPGIEASELNGRSVMIGAANKMLDTLFQVPELKNSLLYSNI